MDMDVIFMKRYYPVMLDVSGKAILIVGGGKVAQRKVDSLLEAGAQVTVIALELSAKLMAQEAKGVIAVKIRAYLPGDSAGFALVIAATDQPEVNAAVEEEAKSHGAWVNVTDRPDLSSFIVPAVVRRGKLVLSVSTGGASPSVARSIARELEAAYGAEYEIYLDFLGEFRLKVQSCVKDIDTRRRIFKRALDWDILGKIRNGSFGSWKRKLDTAMKEDPTLDTFLP
jgi:precorrin-2 dehydrogenase / sirohydrochlorin ferrochelatase